MAHTTERRRLLPEEVAWVAERWSVAHAVSARVWRMLDQQDLFVQMLPYAPRHVVALHYELLKYGTQDELPTLHFVDERRSPILDRRGIEVNLLTSERAAAEQMLAIRRAYMETERAAERARHRTYVNRDCVVAGKAPSETADRAPGERVSDARRSRIGDSARDWRLWTAREASVAEARDGYEQAEREHGVEFALWAPALATFAPTPEGAAMVAATRAASLKRPANQTLLDPDLQILACDLEPASRRARVVMGSLFDVHGVPARGLWCFCHGHVLYAWVPERHRPTAELQRALAPERYRWVALRDIARL